MSFSILKNALPSTVREIRIHFSPSSKVVKDYIRSNYLNIKSLNPELPILIREANESPTRAFFRFERGVERAVSLDQVSDESQINEKLSD
ncbi:hypothetical protein PPACK8108_LOCUS24783 [Phakopsora pachyrhizi]|uniref:Ribosomal protein/NADH dehydrogenase domain-containing protein n=1 Tax=Phakopsora pachyrhizi TaxID=170000 RepID=A0AAV0BQM0_PHAPC|nr:hypothetical protein PPACK8108_LOCUS24783 [Phakopsora pachyrhizi]